MSEKEKNKPEKKFRAGPITATIWKNKLEKDGKEVEYKTVSVERNYKDKQDQWQSTTSLRAHDIPNALLVLNKTFEYMQFKEVDLNNGNSAAPTEEDIY